MLAPIAIATTLLLVPPPAAPPDSSPLCGITAFVLRLDVGPGIDSGAMRGLIERELAREGVVLVGGDRTGGAGGGGGVGRDWGGSSAALMVTLRMASGGAHPVHGGMTLVEVVQEGRVQRSPGAVYTLITWRRGNAWLAGSKSLTRVVEESVRHQVGSFVIDYRKADCGRPTRVRADSVVALAPAVTRRIG